MVALATVALAMLAMFVIDWQQTLVIARNPGRWSERNLVLGQHPTVGRVNVYFAVALVAIAAVAAVVPLPWAIALLAAVAGVEGWCVVHNYRGGVRIALKL
jgi:hypothetical protein